VGIFEAGRECDLATGDLCIETFLGGGFDSC